MVALYAKERKLNQMAEFFATSVPNINIHISNILKDNELEKKSVIKDYLITASDGKIIFFQHQSIITNPNELARMCAPMGMQMFFVLA